MLGFAPLSSAVHPPQTFYNLNPDGDIFNHANVHFWDYTQPGYDALGLISCTGTNFLVRARAFQQAGRGTGWGREDGRRPGRRARTWLSRPLGERSLSYDTRCCRCA